MVEERNVAFVYPISSALKELKENLEQDEGYTVYELDNIGEYSQLIGVMEFSVTFSSHPAKTERYLEQCKSFVKNKTSKNFLLSSEISNRELTKLQKLGLDEQLPEDTNIKSLMRKLDMFYGPFEQTALREAEAAEKEEARKDKAEKLRQERFEASQAMKDQGIKGELNQKKSVDLSFLDDAKGSDTLRLDSEGDDFNHSDLNNLKRKEVAQFDEVVDTPKLQTTDFEPIVGELNQEKQKSLDLMPEGELNQAKKASHDFDQGGELGQKKSHDFKDLSEGSDKKKRAKLDDNSGELNQKDIKTLDIDELDPDRKRKQHDFEENKSQKKSTGFDFGAANIEKKKRAALVFDDSNLNKKRNNFEESNLDLKKRKKTFQEIEEDYNKRKTEFDESELNFSKKKKQFEEMDLDDDKKKRLKLVDDEFNRKKVDFEEVDGFIKKKIIQFEAVDAILSKKENDFQEVEAEIKKKNLFFESEENLKKKKGILLELEELKRKKGTILTGLEKGNKKKQQLFEEVAINKKLRLMDFLGVDIEKKLKGFTEVSIDGKKRKGEGELFGDGKESGYEEELAMGKAVKEAETLDYNEFRRQMKSGELHLDKNRERVILKKKIDELCSDKEFIFFHSETRYLNYLLTNLDMYFQGAESAKLYDHFKEVLQKELGGDYILYKGSSMPSLLHTSYPQEEESIPRLNGSFSSYEKSKQAEWGKITIPVWSDETYQDDFLEYIYPIFDNNEQHGFLVIHTGEQIKNHEDADMVEFLLMGLKGFFINEVL